MDPCDGERGIRLANGTGGATFFPTTNNPFYGMNADAAYEILFNINVFDAIGSGAVVEIYVDDNPVGTGGLKVGESDGFPDDSTCYSASVAITDPDKVGDLTGYPFIIFKTKNFNPILPPASPIVSAAIDGISACTVFSIEASLSPCDQICLGFSSDCFLECDSSRHYNPEMDDCFVQIIWYTDDEYEEALGDTCYFPFIGNEECCITPTSYGMYFPIILVNYTLNGDEIAEAYFPVVDFQACSTVVISTTTTWDASDIDPNARFDLITVQSGKTLTIDADLTLKFCENGKLIINPGGQVILNGVLTTGCSTVWEGVEVQGNGTTNQVPVSHIYPQGRLVCNKGSKIEHAKTAVKLYGPTYYDSGGMIFANGTTFLNNNKGLDFAPFGNFYPYAQDQKVYRSSIRECAFDLDEDYLFHGPLTQHIKLNGVFGLNILGTYFGNGINISGAFSGKVYGTGIMAINSGFSVGPTADDPEEEPCVPPCTIKNESKFYGLGMGISVGRSGRNKPFEVYNTTFENCFFGISNEGVSGANILFNTFKMGDIKEINNDENQVGISMSSYQEFGSIQENTFIHDAGNADFTIGIVANSTGEFNNAIRRNEFIGMHVGNEAFLQNGTGDPEDPRGLVYLCNLNENTLLNDFYVKNTSSDDYINVWQGQIEFAGVLAAGNTFSGTGDPGDGYFGNYGEELVDYHYNISVLNQVPDEDAIVGIELLDVAEGNCDANYCLFPCVPGVDLDDEIDAYYNNSNDYRAAIDLEDILEAGFYRMAMDSNICNISRYHEMDTTAFNRDTLRAWYKRTDAIAGDLLLAGDYFDSGTYTHAQQTIDSISIRYNTTVDQDLDLTRVKTIYNILASRSVFALTSADIDSLNKYSIGAGASFSISRNVLAVLDSVYTPRYYIPGEINPRNSTIAIIDKPAQELVKVYPNPAASVLMVDFSVKDLHNLQIELYTLDGKLCEVQTLKGELNTLQLNQTCLRGGGIFIYRITSSLGILKQGKLILIN